MLKNRFRIYPCCGQKLEHNKKLLYALVSKYNLQIRGSKGEKTEVENAVFDISNNQRLGISEVEIIQNLHKGLVAVIQAEKSL